ncbi:MAG: hypothetical protein AB8B46_04605 [Candidatus Midichloriaceae bacterium]
MKRFILLVFFILFFAIYPINQRNVNASPTSEILCNGWLAATTGINCTTGKCTPNPSPSTGGNDSDTYTISDDVGVRGVSRDYFPTWGEREMFYRTSDDPLNMELIVKRQYCWARYAFFPSPANCGGPDWKWKFPLGYLSWSEGVNYAIWGDTVTKTFSLQKRGSDNAQTIFWGSNHAYIDYEKSNGIENPKRVCAYFSPVAFGKIVSSDDRLIGCIDIPLNPAPNIYNKIIVPKRSVIIDGGTPAGSTFINPKINLQVIDSTGQKIGGYISLGYNYMDGSVKCSSKEDTLGDIYCPFVQPGAPTKICAGLQGKSSSNIGCIDRPKPSGPKNGAVHIEAVHDYYIDNACPDSSKINSKPSIFHSLKIQIKDPSIKDPIKSIIKEFPGAGNGLRDYYACYQTGQNPNDQSIKTSVLSGHDTVDVFGVQFSAVIPKFVDKDGKDVKDYTKIGIEKIRPQNFKKTHMYPLITTKQARNSGNCGNCFIPVKESQCIDNNPTSKQKGQSKCSTYITPAGERERDSCAKNYVCYDFANHPLPIEIIDGKMIIEDNSINCAFGSKADDLNKAEKAYCHGIYKLEQEEKNAICMNLDTKWPDFFGKADSICAEIPASFMKLEKNAISSLTGYIDFTNDGFKSTTKYKDTDRLIGECNAKLNLENEKCLSRDDKKCLDTFLPDEIEGLDENENIKFKVQYTVINQYLYGKKEGDASAKGINANIQAIDKKLMGTLGYASSKQEFSAIDIPLPDGAPYRTLNGNFPIGNIYNGCRFAVGEDGCGINTDTAPFLGNAYFDASSHNLNIKSPLTITKLTTIYPKPPQDKSDLIIKDIPIDGKCEDGLVPSDITHPPQRMCRVIVDKDNNIITKSWSDQAIINPCVSNKKSNG